LLVDIEQHINQCFREGAARYNGFLSTPDLGSSHELHGLSDLFGVGNRVDALTQLSEPASDDVERRPAAGGLGREGSRLGGGGGPHCRGHFRGVVAMGLGGDLERGEMGPRKNKRTREQEIERERVGERKRK
jgi:hypothetical protein